MFNARLHFFHNDHCNALFGDLKLLRLHMLALEIFMFFFLDICSQFDSVFEVNTHDAGKSSLIFITIMLVT